VKYIEASNAQNAYKIGTYLVERSKLKLATISLMEGGSKVKQIKSKRGSFLNALLAFLNKKA